MKTQPRVSVLIPAFAADRFVHEAVDSILAQDYPHIETIVIPDDGDTYSHLRKRMDSTRLRLLPTDRHSGPGGARNRGIDAATGDFIAVCDADDLWPSNYLSTLVPLAEEAGACAAAVRYTDWDGLLVRTPPVPPQCLTLSGYGQLLASAHPVLHCSFEVGYVEGVAEDVVHDLHLIAALGGQITVSTHTHYQARERNGSLTDTHGDDGRFQQAYQRYSHTARFRPTQLGMQRLSAPTRSQIAQAFDFRRFVSEQYQQFAESGQSYNQFVAGTEARLWDEFYAYATQHQDAQLLPARAAAA